MIESQTRLGATHKPEKALPSMSYEPLHHKYRPKSFAELVGQEAIATTLTNAIRASKIAPAYLFTGPRGTGKTSSARILAKSLNCLKSDKPTAEPCGVCDVCQGITKGYSLDVIEIDAASNTGVDNIREIIERAQFAPVQCRYKVYVVDECHMLSTAAFNALLKTLEEPPKHVIFVLATTDPQRVLPTIISRCQRFDFRRIPLEAMVQHLSTIATKENININPEAITLVAQIAQGGLRDAESLLDQLSLLSGEVTPDQVWDLVGSVSERDLLTLLGAIATDNPEAVVDCTRQILDRGREPLIILQNFAAFYRDLLIAKTAPSRQNLVACTPQTWQALVSFAQQLDISTILQGQQHLRTAEVQLKNTTQPRLWLEVTLLGWLPSATIRTQPSTTNRVVPTVSPTPFIPPSPVSNGKTTQVQRDTGNQQDTTTQQHSNNEKSSVSPPLPTLPHTPPPPHLPTSPSPHPHLLNKRN
nr:DNA polymerase III subunit gamma/tau [Fischerella sp. JS2]